MIRIEDRSVVISLKEYEDLKEKNQQLLKALESDFIRVNGSSYWGVGISYVKKDTPMYDAIKSNVEKYYELNVEIKSNELLELRRIREQWWYKLFFKKKDGA